MLDDGMEEIKAGIKEYSPILKKIRKELAKVIIGQEEVIDALLQVLLSNGNVLVEGVPGVAKTLTIKTLATAVGCEFKRIQFTADLLPTDILGITAYDEKKGFYTVKGPIFANFILADEINRAPAKTQSALMEAMQEKQVTIGKQTFKLERPFFVMATENPIEQSGTYPLPEAQIDRFLFKLMVDYPKLNDEVEIMARNANLKKFDEFGVNAVIGPEKILEMQEFVKKIYLKEEIRSYIANIVDATRHPKEAGISLGRYIEWGSTPRASINMFIASKTEALFNKSHFVTPQHVKDVAYDVLRHRLLLNYEGQAEGIKPEQIIDEILSKVPVP